MVFLGSNIQLTKPYIKGDNVLPPLHAADEREKLPFGPQNVLTPKYLLIFINTSAYPMISKNVFVNLPSFRDFYIAI